MKCYECKQHIDEYEHSNCPYCGSPLICHTCGYVFSSGVSVCPVCSAKESNLKEMERKEKANKKTMIAIAIVAFILLGFLLLKEKFVFIALISMPVLFFILHDKYRDKQSQMTKEELLAIEEYRKEIEEEKMAKKYNRYLYTCPMCGSNKIMDISTLNKSVSIEVFGLASKNLGKNYQCDDCKYRW